MKKYILAYLSLATMKPLGYLGMEEQVPIGTVHIVKRYFILFHLHLNSYFTFLNQDINESIPENSNTFKWHTFYTVVKILTVIILGKNKRREFGIYCLECAVIGSPATFIFCHQETAEGNPVVIGRPRSHSPRLRESVVPNINVHVIVSLFYKQ